MKRIILFACAAAIVISTKGYALDNNGHTVKDFSSVISLVNQLKSENLRYYKSHKADFFDNLSKGQHPLATVVTCSDSRVHTHMFNANPEGKLFMVRNIGNQFVTAQGTIEYGVQHLHTPFLLFIGHSRCGAIDAVSGDYSKESPAIKRELDTIAIGKNLSNADGVVANVHNQVTAAMLKFDAEIKSKKLAVVGAVLDFADDMHFGAGHLNIINVNGEKFLSTPGSAENLYAQADGARVKRQKNDASTSQRGTSAKPGSADDMQNISGRDELYLFVDRGVLSSGDLCDIGGAALTISSCSASATMFRLGAGYSPAEGGLGVEFSFANLGEFAIEGNSMSVNSGPGSLTSKFSAKSFMVPLTYSVKLSDANSVSLRLGGAYTLGQSNSIAVDSNGVVVPVDTRANGMTAIYGFGLSSHIFSSVFLRVQYERIQHLNIDSNSGINNLSLLSLGVGADF